MTPSTTLLYGDSGRKKGSRGLSVTISKSRPAIDVLENTFIPVVVLSKVPFCF